MFLQVPITKHDFTQNAKYFQNYTHYSSSLNFKLSYMQLIYKICRFISKSKKFLHVSPNVFCKISYYTAKSLNLKDLPNNFNFLTMFIKLATVNFNTFDFKTKFYKLTIRLYPLVKIFMLLLSSHIEVVIFKIFINF